MSDPNIVITLKAKREEIERSIVAYEAKLTQARHDLAHLSATLAVFQAGGDERQVAAFIDTRRLLKRGEMMGIVTLSWPRARR